MRLSKEATNGLCHGTASARFLGTSSDAERAANARECNQGFCQGAFDIITHSSQCRSQIWAEPPLKVTSVCAAPTRAASAPPGAPDEQGDAKGEELLELL